MNKPRVVKSKLLNEYQNEIVQRICYNLACLIVEIEDLQTEDYKQYQNSDKKERKRNGMRKMRNLVI